MSVAAAMNGQSVETSLRGKTILVTRPIEQSREMAAEIERRGGKAVVIPMMQISEIDWTQCDEAIASLKRYDGVLFTSGNAVEKFFLRCDLKKVFSPAFDAIKVFAVGEKTESMLKDYGIRAPRVPKEFSSASLSKMFLQEEVKGRRFLFPKGNLSREEAPHALRSLGATVDEVDVYKTTPPSGETLREVAERFLRKEFDVITFASPSAVKSLREAVMPEMFELIRHHTKVAVIGPTTRAAAEEAGYKVDIEPAQATSHDLVEAIASHYLNPEP